MQISKAKLEQFLTNYEVGDLLSYQQIELGLMNKIVLLETSAGKYVLKILIQNNSGNKLVYELDLLNYLVGLPTPKPITTKKSKYWTMFGTNKAFLMEYMAGVHKKEISNADLKNIGIFLGKMHNQTANFKSKIKRLETLSHSLSSLKSIYKSCEVIKDRKIIDAIKYTQNQIVAYLPPKDVVMGAIHSDLKPENCLFKNNVLSGVVDFDNSYIAPLTIDLANTIIWFCTDKNNLNLKKAKILTNAYLGVRKLNKEENEYLPKAIHFVYLRNLLRGIEYFAMKKVEKDLVYWAIDNFLSAEQKLQESQFR